ncbi:Rieske 2Fe-2S domain-containing protein [bacterium]|nr:Rieske 2Fe-2S domain-containing protein [bacterium]
MPAGERVCALDDLPMDKGREFVVDGQVVAVFRTEDGVFAVDGICPHAGGPIAQGMVRKDVVTCPWHGWQYDIRTGCHQINPRICLKQFNVTVEGDGVYIANSG